MIRLRSHADAGRAAARHVLATASLLLFAAAPASPEPQGAGGLTEGKRLAAIYDLILQARFQQADEQLKTACPPAPVEACQALRTVAAWWEIQIDPESRRLDDRFNEIAAASIAASEAWTRRAPGRAEAWFYLAASHGPLVQWRVLRGERLAAAREGKTIKESLERALSLDPNLHDAYFGLGLYHYYADVAPPAAKILRFVLLLPGGDRAQGLQEMLKARDRGEVLRGEADYQLQQVYLWYEQKPVEALQALQRLDTRYGNNPLFLQKIAEVRDIYFQDHPASAAAWQTLLARARKGAVHDPARTAMRARVGLAGQLDALYETDRASDELEIVLGAKGDELPEGVREQAQKMLDAARQRMSDEAYHLSLEGWRALERNALADAEPALTRAVALAPADSVTRYRYARLLQHKGDTARAHEELEKVIAASPPAPAFVQSLALTADARLSEAGGDRARALALYQLAIDVAGGDLRARDDARRAIRRLQPPTKK